MASSIQSIALDKLVRHPDNPNKMSRTNLSKLVRNIERTGRYEPLVVRPHPKDRSYFEIINGYHRCKALEQLGYDEADCVVWDINDEGADILLATLNRLSGSDELGKKLSLLNRLNKRMESAELAKLLPHKQKQIERLTNLKMPAQPVKIAAKLFANPMVFFVNDTQQQIINTAISLVEEKGFPDSRLRGNDIKTKAAKKAAALTHIARYFLNNSTAKSGNFR